MNNVAHGFGMFALDALVVAVGTAAFAATLAVCFFLITDAKLKGSDPDQQGVAAMISGIIIGGVVGLIWSIVEVCHYTPGDALVNLIGWEFLFAIIVAVVAFIARRVYGRR